MAIIKCRSWRGQPLGNSGCRSKHEHAGASENHASIIGWSYGNEATYTRCPLDNTYCFWAAAMAVLNRDPSRLRMYERESDGYYHRYQKDAGADPWGMETRSKNIVDVHSTQYPEAKNVESYAKNTNNKLPYLNRNMNMRWDSLSEVQ